MAIGTSDQHARQHWGGATYDRIPKSVFATVAWHLANLASGECDTPGAAELRFVEELRALALNGIIPAKQAAYSGLAIAEASAPEGGSA